MLGVSCISANRKGLVMTISHFHTVVWIDHRQAKIFHFSAREDELVTLHAENQSMHIHHKSNTIGSGHEPLDQSFLREVVGAIATASEVLILGPGNAKTELATHIAKHDPKTRNKILGVETVDHPSDGQIVAYARAYFKSADAMRPQQF